MKKILIIGILLNTCFAFSQASPSIQTNLENEFGSEKLEGDHLTVFEFRAKQKVVDFCNYIELISDKKIDRKLRTHAIKTASSLFYSEGCSISDSIVVGSENELRITEYLEKLTESNYEKMEAEAIDIELSYALTPEDANTYLGTISYTHLMRFYDDKEQLIHESTEKKEVAVILSMETKKFGEIEKIIWGVYLCDIFTIK